MHLNHRDNLERISIQLDKAYSLLGFLGDHFEEATPDVNRLQMGYRAHSHLLNTINDIIFEQKRLLDEAIYELQFYREGGDTQ